jgi:hypothetical protein
VALLLNLADQEMARAGRVYQEEKPLALGCGGATIAGGPARSLTDEVSRLDAP